jgi:nicotinate dehydrogenase subunit B
VAGPGLSPGFPGLTKPVSQYKIVGVTDPPRLDVPDKVTGKYVYVHNIKIPGMIHGRVVRPRGQGGYGDGTNPAVLSVDARSISRIPGAKVVQKGNFVGVVAPREYDAIQAAAQLKVKWAPMPPLAGDGNLWKQMRDFDSAGLAPARIVVSTGNTDAALAGAAKTVSQTYKYHYNGQLPIGPSCCVADVNAAGVRFYSNAQNLYAVRQSVANILGLTLDKVRGSYYEGSSVYGSSPQTDVAESAALMSQLAGAPVRLQFMRRDEHGWDNYGPAMMWDIKGGIDAKGNIVATDATVFGIPAGSTAPPEHMTGMTKVTFGVSGASDSNNTGTQYNQASRRVIGKSLPLQNNYFKTAPLRAPQAPQGSPSRRAPRLSGPR